MDAMSRPPAGAGAGEEGYCIVRTKTKTAAAAFHSIIPGGLEDLFFRRWLPLLLLGGIGAAVVSSSLSLSLSFATCTAFMIPSCNNYNRPGYSGDFNNDYNNILLHYNQPNIHNNHDTIITKDDDDDRKVKMSSTTRTKKKAITTAVAAKFHYLNPYQYHPKQIVKRIQACGNNSTAALQILYTAQPFLKPQSQSQQQQQQPLSSSFSSSSILIYPDPKPICAMITVLSRTGHYSIAQGLLSTTIDLYHQQQQQLIGGSSRNSSSIVVSTNYVLAVYKSIIGMLAVQDQQQPANINPSNSSLYYHRIIQYLYHDIPHTINTAADVGAAGNEEDRVIPQNIITRIPALPINVYHCAIAAFGKCRRIDAMFELLHNLEAEQLISISQQQQQQQCDDIIKHDRHTNTARYEYTLPQPDRMTYLAALTGCIRGKTSYELSIAVLLQRMKQRGIPPDKIIYTHVLSFLANTQCTNRYTITKQLWSEMEQYDAQQEQEKQQQVLLSSGGGRRGGVLCTDAIYKILLRIFSKEKQWTDVAIVKERMLKKQQQNCCTSVSSASTTRNTTTICSNGGSNSSSSDSSWPLVPSSSPPPPLVDDGNSSVVNETALRVRYNQDLEKLKKITKNMKKPWYKLGTVRTSNNDDEIVFGIQVHRNAIANGLSLVFYTSSLREKLGFILLRNQVETNNNNKKKKKKSRTRVSLLFSNLVGMYINEDHRGKGLANTFLAVWLKICLESEALPRTEIINKPLLSLVLTKNFGFVPVSDTAVEVEISPIIYNNNDDNNTIILADDVKINNMNTVNAATVTATSVITPPSPPPPQHRQDGEYDSTRTKTGSGHGSSLLASPSSWEPRFALYSNNPLNFGNRELRIQKMVITRHRDTRRGKNTFVRTRFEHPITQKVQLQQQRTDDNGHYYCNEFVELSDFIENIWNRGDKRKDHDKKLSDTNSDSSTGGMNLDIDKELLRRVIFGYLF